MPFDEELLVRERSRLIRVIGEACDPGSSPSEELGQATIEALLAYAGMMFAKINGISLRKNTFSEVASAALDGMVRWKESNDARN